MSDEMTVALTKREGQTIHFTLRHRKQDILERLSTRDSWMHSSLAEELIEVESALNKIEFWLAGFKE